MIDVVLGGLLILALWPLLRMRRWKWWLQQQQTAGQLRRLRIGLRLGWEFALPLTLLIGARLLLHALGAQSWVEGLLLFPDFGAWLWVFSLLVLFTGATRLVLLWGVLRGNDKGNQAAYSQDACSPYEENLQTPT
jgi:hypothetical protein